MSSLSSPPFKQILFLLRGSPAQGSRFGFQLVEPWRFAGGPETQPSVIIARFFELKPADVS